MDTISDPAVESVVVMSGSQIGKTEIVNNIVGFHIDQDPAPILVVMPTLEMGEAWSKDRLAPMLRDTPALAGRVKDPRARDSGNTLLHKVFPGGHLTICGANSPSSLASRPIRVVLCDEVDRYPASAGTEGDPVTLARKRAATFWNRKLILTSTPTVKGRSRIETAWEGSDQRRFHVACPHCRAEQILSWLGVKWPDKAPERAAFHCDKCGAAWTDAQRWAAIGKGRWIAGEPFAGVAGFHLNELYSPWAKVADIARSFVEAERSPETLKAWVNTSLGETFSPEADSEYKIEARELQEAAKDIPLGVIPDGGEVLVASIDNQNNRFEIAWTAHGRDGEAWLVDYQKIVAVALDGTPITVGGAGSGAVSLVGSQPCDPAHQLEHWLALVPSVFDRALPFASDPTRGLKPLVVAMDTHGPAGATDKAYRFARWLRRERPELSSRAMFLRGRGELNPIRVARAQWDPKITQTRVTNRRGVDLWNVYVNLLKDGVTARLRHWISGKGERGPDRLHLSAQLPEQVFEQICSEVRDGAGKWENERRVANEALDLAVYGLAAWLRIGGDKIDWTNPPKWARPAGMAVELSPSPVSTPIDNPKAAATALPSRTFRAPSRTGGWVNKWKV